MPKTLGEVDHTERGFEIVKFKDSYGEKCSLQMSSLANYQQPGISAVWLGPDGDGIRTRMHLKREQVEALIEALQSWLEHGHFEPPVENN